MKSTTVLATALILVWGCKSSKRPPEIAATPQSTCRCDYQAHEPCPELEAELDRSTPGCVIPPEALPQHEARENVFENKYVKQIFAACRESADVLPSTCPNPSTKVNIRTAP